jgi:hypothetical protein
MLTWPARTDAVAVERLLHGLGENLERDAHLVLAGVQQAGDDVVAGFDAELELCFFRVVVEGFFQERGVFLGRELGQVHEAEPAPELPVVAEERQQFRDAGQDQLYGPFRVGHQVLERVAYLLDLVHAVAVEDVRYVVVAFRRHVGGFRLLDAGNEREIGWTEQRTQVGGGICIVVGHLRSLGFHSRGGLWVRISGVG